MKYLGINLVNIYRMHMLKTAMVMQKVIDLNERFIVVMIGRLSIVKMSILPKSIYVFNTLLIKLFKDRDRVILD